MAGLLLGAYLKPGTKRPVFNIVHLRKPRLTLKRFTGKTYRQRTSARNALRAIADIENELKERSGSLLAMGKEYSGLKEATNDILEMRDLVPEQKIELIIDLEELSKKAKTLTSQQIKAFEARILQFFLENLESGKISIRK